MPFMILSPETGVIQIGLEGNLDSVTVGRLRAELVCMARRQPVRVVVDLSHLRSVPPRDIHGLVAIVADLVRTGCRISVTGARDQRSARLHAALGEAIHDGSGLAN
jgi:hypothetical protein